MTHPDRADWLLIGGLLPIWLLCTGMSFYAAAVTESRYLPVNFESAKSPNDFPTVIGPRVSDPLEVGDRLLRMGDRDLRGWTVIPFFVFTPAHLDSGGNAELQIERNGELLSVRVATQVDTQWWLALPFTISLVLCAGLIRIRAEPPWHLRRRFLAASLLWAIALTTRDTGLPRWDLATAVLDIPATAAGMALTLWNCFEFGERRRLAAWQRLLGPAVGASWVVSFLIWGWLPTPLSGPLAGAAMNAALVAFLALMISIMTAQYRRADGLQRRRGRWGMLGLYVALLPLAALLALSLFFSFGQPLYQTLRGIAFFALAALPVSLLVSIVWYDFLDVDRLISATATWTVLGLVLAGAGLLVIPRLGELLADRAGIDPASTSVALCLILVAAFVPAQRRLRPRLDRALFRAQHERQQAIARLLESLERADSLEALARLTGPQLNATFEPESLSLYAREGQQFTPLFANAQPVPPAFPVCGGLVATLGEGRARVLATRGAHGDSAPLDPFDRAALETLDAAVALPIRREETLVAFLCLGPQRSGDIYTATDLALLMAVATRISDVIQRLDTDQLLGEARDLQQKLRRYVPGPLAAALSEGREIASGEREVSVLFVDMRGYSGFSESRTPSEIFGALSRYSETVSRIVDQHGGTIVEFMGDGMMVVFGAVADAAEKERSAVAAALDIVEAVRKLPLAGERLEVGVGIATGAAFVGEIQSKGRHFWSAIGNTTNLAARLQTLTRGLDASIAIDATTAERAGGLCAGFVEHRDVPIRGRSDKRVVRALPLRAPR